MQKVRLLRRCPPAAPRPFAVAAPRPIEDDDPMVCLQQEIDDPTGVPIVARYGRSVDQDDRTPLPTVAEVQPHAVDGDELSARWMSPLCSPGDQVIDEGKTGESADARENRTIGFEFHGHDDPGCSAALSPQINQPLCLRLRAHFAARHRTPRSSVVS